MSWEEIRSKGKGVVGCYGEMWNKVPCVSVGKCGLTFNFVAAEAFGIERGQYMRILFDPDRRVLGFKRCVNDEDLVGSYKVSLSGHGKITKSDTFHIHCDEIGKKCPDCIGHAYRAHLNAGERVIETELSSTNMTFAI